MKTIAMNERVTFKCPSTLVRAVEKAAAQETLSTSAWIRRLVVERLRDEKMQTENSAA
jgi:hypothetical protein